MSDTYKIDITIGNARFSAEGPRDAVESAFKAWRDLLAQPIAAAPIPAAAQSPSPQPEAPAGAPSDALLARVFSMDGPTGVSLRILPRTDKAAADALILLLYGFLKLRSEGAVTALRLNQGANRSGLRLPRVDRVIAARGGLITQAGSRRGKRYGLNNPGVAHAERLLGEILN